MSYKQQNYTVYDEEDLIIDCNGKYIDDPLYLKNHDKNQKILCVCKNINNPILHNSFYNHRKSIKHELWLENLNKELVKNNSRIKHNNEIDALKQKINELEKELNKINKLTSK
jgi:hypothetical protein